MYVLATCTVPGIHLKSVDLLRYQGCRPKRIHAVVTAPASVAASRTPS